jgi:hypothetical protein
VEAIRFLKQQHRTIDALFRRYERSGNRSAEQNRAIFEQIQRTIITHAVLEELYVYPLLAERAPEGRALSEQAINEHAEVERSLDRLESMSPESGEFDTLMHHVIELVRHHVHEEEAQQPMLFELLRSLTTKTEQVELGRTLAAVAKLTPTRAHPLAPDHPPANKVLGVPLGVIDRLRDALSGRSDAVVKRPRRRRASRKAASARPRSRRAPGKRAAARGGRTTAKRRAARRAQPRVHRTRKARRR